jgi:hypothetical protein
MLAQGTPLRVPEILGHASIVITKDVYGHLVEGDKRSAAELMSQVLFGSRRRPWLRCGSRRAAEGTSAQPERACELGALGGTRIPTL